MYYCRVYAKMPQIERRSDSDLQIGNTKLTIIIKIKNKTKKETEVRPAYE